MVKIIKESHGFSLAQREYMEKYDIIGEYWRKWAHGHRSPYPDRPVYIPLPSIEEGSEQLPDYLKAFAFKTRIVYGLYEVGTANEQRKHT